MEIRAKIIGLVLISAIALAACGGGGGGGGIAGTGGATSSPATATTLTGSAAKGFLAGADITVYAIVNGARERVIATGTTDANGDFSGINLGTYVGPALIEVVANARTIMEDELKGVTPAPLGLTLRAAVAEISNLSTIHVTAFSELAAQAAIKNGLSNANIDVANQAISQEFLGGTSTLTTKPVKVANYTSATPAQQALVKALTALTVLADKGRQTDSKGASCAAGDYAARLRCTLDGLTSTLSVSNGTATLTAAKLAVIKSAFDDIDAGLILANGSNSSDTMPVLASQLRLADDVATGRDIVFTGVSTTDNNILAAMALFNDLRSNVLDVSKVLNTGTLPQDLANDQNNNLDGLSSALSGNIRRIAEGARLAKLTLRGQAPIGSDGCIRGAINSGTATCTDLIGFVPPNSVDTRRFSIRCTSATSCNWDESIVRQTGAVTVQINPANPALKRSGSITTTLDGNGNPKTHVVSGQIVPVSPNTQYADLNFTLDITNRDLTTGAGTMTLQNAALLSRVTDSGGNVTSTPVTLTVTTGVLTGVLRAGVLTPSDATLALNIKSPLFTYTGDLVLTRYTASATRLGGPAALVRPTRATFTGTVADATRTFFNGTIDASISNWSTFDPSLSESPTNFVRATAAISGKLTLTASRTVDLTFTLNRSVYDSAFLSMNYQYITAAGTTATTILGFLPITENAIATLEIANTAGVKINLSAADKTTGPVLRGTTVVGNVNINRSKVDFTDGSTQSLF